VSSIASVQRTTARSRVRSRRGKPSVLDESSAGASPSLNEVLTAAHLECRAMSLDTAEEALEPLPGRGVHGGANAPPRSAATGARIAPRRLWHFDRLAVALERLRWPFAIYLSSRILYLVVALVNSPLRGWSVRRELSNWDGLWYWRLAGMGYPDHVAHIQTTQGFFPLYPMQMWLVQHTLWCSIILAGLLISGVGGFVATVLIQRLSAGWWGEEASRRAVVLFCFFPGSVVFSMVYSEGTLIPLIAGCLLALERRRWLLAGVLAAFATAVGPTAVPIILACAAAALIEIRRRGWRDREARKALIAPLLAPVGIVAFGAFLWAWTGSPFATYYAQHHEWSEKTNPLALVTLVMRLADQVFPSFHDVNLNYVVGLVGAAFLILGLVLLAKTRPRISAPALVWTFGVAFLAITSENVPPNPRMLITAFPVVLVLAHRVKGRAFTWLVAASVVLLVVTSALTYVHVTLRP
jgi:hypothetical protein